MFRPAPMLRVETMALRRDLDPCVRELARAGIFHLQPGPEAEAAAPPAEERREMLDRCRSLAVRLERLADDLAISPGEGSYLGLDSLPLWERQASEVERRLERILARRRTLEERKATLASLEVFYRSLEGLETDIGGLGSLTFSVLRLGRLSSQALENLPLSLPRIIFFTLDVREGSALVVVLGSSRREKTIDRALAEADFRSLPLPSRLEGSPKEAGLRLRRLLGRTEIRIARSDALLAGLHAELTARIGDRLRTLRAEERLLSADSSHRYTERTVTLSGWIPAAEAGRLKKSLEEACEGRFLLRRRRASGDLTPVAFENPAPLRPFEAILKAYGTPAYGEIEPTPLLAAGFLLMFGCMFGDVGHGLLLTLAGLALRRLTRFSDMGLLLAEAGVVSAFFGLVFGSVFGSEEVIAPLWISPLHKIPTLLLAALALGVFVNLAGVVVGVINDLGRRPFRSILTDRQGLAGLVFYGGAVFIALLLYLEKAPPASFFLLALPLGAIFIHPLLEKGDEAWPLKLVEGAVEVLETLLGYLANTFSFLRVAAFGLAHVGLSMAVFAVAERVGELPLALLWVVFVHLVGNLIILALEGLVVSVQTVRLQFYEFFTKFFHGGGVEFRPLSLDSSEKRRV